MGRVCVVGHFGCGVGGRVVWKMGMEMEMRRWFMDKLRKDSGKDEVATMVETGVSSCLAHRATDIRRSASKRNAKSDVFGDG